MRRHPAIGAAYLCPVIRATFSWPAPRPHPLALSGVETPVNLAFVEAVYALESLMEFSKRVLIVDDEPNVVGVLLEFLPAFGTSTPTTSYRRIPMPRRSTSCCGQRSISFCSTWSFQG